MKVMQIGYGYWGNNVAKKLVASKMFEFKYLVETDANRRENAHKNLPTEIEILESYEEKLAEVDGVVICTQTEYSYDIALNAMRAGKHVFTEKPIASTVEKTYDLINCAKENNVVLHCDHLMVYNPVIKYIKNMIDTGEIGEIMYIDISRVNLGPIRKDINAMLDLAVHDIAVIDYLLGNLEPEHLNAYGTKFYGNQETITYLTMKSGETLININSSWVSPVKVRRTLIAGTKKMLIFDDVKMDKLCIYDSGIDVKQGSAYGEYEYQTRVGDIYMSHIKNEDSLQNSLEHFAECVIENKESLSGPEQSLRVMKVLERAQNALQKQ
ncbi:MAG: Gfo/Idh/MocA family oxidoreductase [Lachnospiraceae bacterium]|nr:Gfo/Idh/MocA family oxidoreductase [Lachnospiraceae bacterium]